MSLNREQPMRPFLDELGNAIENYELPDGSVTTPKIANGAVNMDKLADDVLIPQPTDAQVTSAVNAALAAHPEWTTTVPDNSLNGATKLIDDTIPDAKLAQTGGILSRFDAVTGAAYGFKNLLSNNLSSQTVNGLAVTVNDDKSVTIVGTASAQTALMMKAALPIGAYKVSGAPAGSNVNTYHMLYDNPATGKTEYVTESNSDNPLDVSEASTVSIYIRVMNGQTINATFYPMVRDATVYPFDTTYVPYGQRYVPQTLTEVMRRARSPWYGKKMNVIGDSIARGSYGNFVVEIQKELWLSVARNYGVGGCCIASTSQDSQYPPVVSRWNDMDDDADIVIVHAGTNDYSAQVPLGDPASTDITTFNGALNTIMDGLRDKYPSALVIFSGILHRYNDYSLTIKASEYREAMESRCLAKHFVYYDGYRWTGFDFIKGYYDHVLTNDGLHPNALGAKILGRKLAGFINWQ